MRIGNGCETVDNLPDNLIDIFPKQFVQIRIQPKRQTLLEATKKKSIFVLFDPLVVTDGLEVAIKKINLNFSVLCLSFMK